jgi:hypothetical protein
MTAHCTSLVVGMILLIALTSTTSSAEVKRPASTQTTSLTVPFDVSASANRLMATHDLRSILSAVKRGKFEKDQFETAAVYEERIRGIGPVGSLKADSLLAFKFSPLDAFPLCQTKYNADAAEMTVDCSVGSKQAFYLPQESKVLRSFTVGVAKATDKRSYVGTNAFGVKTAVTVRKATGYGLAITNLNEVTTGEYADMLRKLTVAVPNITPDTARKIMNDVGFLFVVNMLPPFIVKDSKSQGPTLDSPIDFSGEYEYLHVNLDQLWIVDLKRGDVLQRVDSRGKVIN